MLSQFFWSRKHKKNGTKPFLKRNRSIKNSKIIGLRSVLRMAADILLHAGSLNTQQKNYSSSLR